MTDATERTAVAEALREEADKIVAPWVKYDLAMPDVPDVVADFASLLHQAADLLCSEATIK